jgi:hypothetical protein
MLHRFAAALSVLAAISSATVPSADRAPGTPADRVESAATPRASSPPPPVPAPADPASPASAPRAASSAERASYAARDAASPEAQRYRGGADVVVVSAGTVALALAVVALVLILR